MDVFLSLLRQYLALRTITEERVMLIPCTWYVFSHDWPVHLGLSSVMASNQMFSRRVYYCCTSILPRSGVSVHP